MATIHDETNDVSHAIRPNKPLIIGRGTPQFKLTHPNVSRKQVEINLLDNGSCFIKRLAVNPTLLNGKALPKDNEIQVYNDDIIELIANAFPYKFCLPGEINQRPGQDIVIPPTVSTAIPGEKYYYDENNMGEYQTQQPSMTQYSIEADDYGSPGHEQTSDEDLPLGDENDDNESDGWVSSESSLLGGEGWNDDDDDDNDYDGVYKKDDNRTQKK